jgi:hypothetical protein
MPMRGWLICGGDSAELERFSANQRDHAGITAAKIGSTAAMRGVRRAKKNATAAAIKNMGVTRATLVACAKLETAGVDGALGVAGLKTMPQCGQLGAESETCLPHS